MTPRTTAIINKIRELEEELEEELAERTAELNFKLQGRRVRFEQAIIERHRQLRVHVLSYLAQARPLAVLTAPLIYALVIPFALLDLCVTLYQALCFPIYGIPRVKRSEYFLYDRSQLAYLNAIEKLNCLYCSYANGVIAYLREIGARTEQHWCPIKHSRRVLATHARYGRFVDFGDAEAYRAELQRIRTALEQEAARPQR